MVLCLDNGPVLGRTTNRCESMCCDCSLAEPPMLPFSIRSERLLRSRLIKSQVLLILNLKGSLKNMRLLLNSKTGLLTEASPWC